MKTIAFDVMGNDKGVMSAVKAANKFVKSRKDYSFILVGNKKEIDQHLVPSERITIVDVKGVVDKKAGVRAARKADNSMAVAINLVKDNKADAVLSSGDSGVYLAMATLLLKRMPGVKRPAFMPIGPKIDGSKFIILDVGANLQTTSEMLVQWAKLGNVFSKVVLGVKKPNIAIVNNGTEDNKGTDVNQAANKILKANKKLNYIGFREPNTLLVGDVDVAVVGGFEGNLILKTLEGTILSLLKVIKTSLKSRLLYKVGALLSKGAYKDVKKKLDLRNSGAAWVIGLNALAIKAHGGADELSYAGAFRIISEGLDNNMMEQFKKAVK